MKENKKDLLSTYLEANVSPLLIDFLSGKDLNNSVVLPANIDKTELNGHYEGIKYLPPKWMNEILTSKSLKILVIDKIDSIPKVEQLKFIELLEARKISTFDLPRNCRIIVTANKISKDTINEEIYSLVAQM